MTLLWLLACTSTVDTDNGETGETTDTAPADTSDTGGAPTFITSPAEAIDLDPDPDVLHVELTAAAHTHTVGELVIDGYAYNGQTPGPTLRARVGDRIVVDFTNQLDATTTIHWHGMSVPYEMDGVVWSLGGVEHGASFRYEFTATMAGTFWYHPHIDSAHQVDHGLYGVVVIENPDDPPVDDVVLVFDDWKATQADTEHAHDEGLWTVNGVADPTVAVRGGSPLRVRALNASNGGYLDLRWPGIRWIGGDQGLLPSLQTPDRIEVGPGDRFEVEWLPGEQGWDVLDHPYAASGTAFGEPETRLRVAVDSPATPPAPAAWSFSGAQVSPDASPTLTYVFTGEGQDWYINGERFPDVTVETLPLDQTSVIEVRNLSGSEHPFHIHGMEFEVLSLNGVAPAFQRIEDTWNLHAYERMRVQVTPRFPGFWMTHCHILEHAEDGMMTVVEVPSGR